MHIVAGIGVDRTLDLAPHNKYMYLNQNEQHGEVGSLGPNPKHLCMYTVWIHVHVVSQKKNTLVCIQPLTP